ncbi:PAS domain-containing sensor histidine kinase [Phyllobacterium sp. SYP-B3895]|uniref:PAS domain-containing sensor histidine kinase n=1 Tax=Phyllobacterium sp. SYP-B3895 TaxID=2663240 RepID=UPI001FED5C6E|nr:PAS domain-containing sensor histidine kinase [Phyllobacterium sp. SYP-B3895]
MVELGPPDTLGYCSASFLVPKISSQANRTRKRMQPDLGRILDSLPGMVFTAVPDGCIDYMNESLAALTGISTPCTWPVAEAGNESRSQIENWRQGLAMGSPFEIVISVLDAAAVPRDLVVRCNPIIDDGRVAKWCGIAVEPPPPRETEFQRIVDSIPVPVAVTTPSGDVRSLNQPALDYFGMSLEALKEWKATEVVHPDDLNRTIDDQIAAHVNGTFYNVESRHLRADGIYRWHNVLGMPLRDADGEILCWFHLLVDIDDRKRAEIELAAQQREARLIPESIPAGVSVLSPDGGIEAANGHLLRYYGRTLDEIRMWPCPDLVHPGDVHRVADVLGSAIANGLPFDIELRLRGAEGRYRWFQVNGHPLKDDDGAVIRWYVLHVDVDDRKRAEQALKDTEYDLRKIINALPAAVWTTLPDGYCDFLNDRWLDYAGYTAEEAEGWGWGSVLHPDDKDELVRGWSTCLSTGLPIDLEARMQRFDGEYRWFLFRANILRDSDGRIVKWLGTNVDIEDRKRAEQALAERERESRLIVDGIAGMIAIFSPAGELMGGNQQLLDYFQLPLEEVKHWDTNGITHPEDLQLCIDTFMGSIVSGEPYDYETRFRRHDGVWRWFQLRGLPLRDEEGRIQRWYGLLTDVDDRKRAEEKLRQSEAFLADAQRLSRTGSFSMILGTERITWSAETYRIFDVDPAAPEVTFSTVLSRVHPDSVQMVKHVIEQARNGWGDFDYEIVLSMPDQSSKNVRVLAHSERNKDGEQELTGAIQDITDSRKAEEALNEARSELSYVTRATSLGVLTASIAHELNQPLAGIVTNASTCLLALGAEPPNIDVANDTARRMIRDANRSADVIVRLRALFSRKPPVIEPVDMNEVAMEAIALATSDLQRARLAVTTHLNGELPPVAGARVQLQQVIMNLLRNAIDAMSEAGGRTRRIIIRTELSAGGDVQLSVEDAGVGLPADDMDRIFDSFYTTKQDGMGIGLSVSRSIVENHNGRLWARANEEQGVTVSFTLPPYVSAATAQNETLHL